MTLTVEVDWGALTRRDLLAGAGAAGVAVWPWSVIGAKNAPAGEGKAVIAKDTGLKPEFVREMTPPLSSGSSSRPTSNP
jgi:hypothetical protein